MTARNVLPQRRFSETFELSHGKVSYRVSVGYFEGGFWSGWPAEVFISAPKSGSEVEAIARDAAVLVSIALQHGVPLDVMAHSITRDSDGRPSTIMGAVLDELAQQAWPIDPPGA
jgi:ribonucleoside-diphosphate reductase alpha chain